MSPSADQLYQAALALPADERAELADRLFDSIEPDPPTTLHPGWGEELHRRLSELDSGQVKPIPWSEVKRSAWEGLDPDEASPRG